MAITFADPGTIHLGGPVQEVNNRAVSEAVAPGHLVLLFNSAGTIRYKKHDGAAVDAVKAVACEHSMANLGVDDSYAANDLCEVKVGAPGASFWMWIASGQNISAGQKLESDGGGRLRAYTTAGGAIFAALENRNNTTGSLAPATLPTGTTAGDARIRVEVI